MSLSTHHSNFGSGGVHSYQFINERDSIYNERRYWGMFCYVLEENYKGLYQLVHGHYNNDISDNRNWLLFSHVPVTIIQQNTTSVAGLESRSTFGASTGSLPVGGSVDLEIVAYKTYLLQWLETSVPAWIRIYCDAASRSADAGRSIESDPSTSGIVCDVVTSSSNLKALVVPSLIGWNNDSPVSTKLYLSIKNLHTSTANVSFSLSLVKLES